MVCHPEYKRQTTYHDLAVIRLSTPVALSSNILPACLASNWTENLYDTLLQTGFGTSSATGTVIWSLRFVVIKSFKKICLSGIKKFIESEDNQVITKGKCEEIIISPSRRLPVGIIPGQLCVINTDQLRTSSQGSSGSPLQSVNTRSCMYTAVGLAIFGILDHEDARESNSTVIDVYTRISHYIDWIEHIVWNAELPVTTTTVRSRQTETSTRAFINTDFIFPDN